MPSSLELIHMLLKHSAWRPAKRRWLHTLYMPRADTWARVAGEVRVGRKLVARAQETGRNQFGCPACLFLVMMSLSAADTGGWAAQPPSGGGAVSHVQGNSLKRFHTPIHTRHSLTKHPSL
jgi:hypothetical protein